VTAVTVIPSDGVTW